MKIHSRNNRGGSVQIKKEIFDDVHAMVQLHRQNKGLAPWDFINRKAMKTLTTNELVTNGVAQVGRPKENKEDWHSIIDQVAELNIGEFKDIFPNDSNVQRWASSLRSILMTNRKTNCFRWRVAVNTDSRSVMVKKLGDWSNYEGGQHTPSVDALKSIDEVADEPQKDNMNTEQGEEQYTTKEVADAIRHLENKNGSVRVKVQAGEKKVKCECQCGGYVPVGNVMQGWTYIYGHKNASGARNNSGKQHRLPITRGQAYEPLLDRIRMDIANVESEMKNVTLEAQKLTVKLQTLKQDLDKLKAAEQALKPLVTTSNNGAHLK